ncbi:MAG TPA: glycosyltransferase family 1 protein [Thermoanaerobaculia bacterium]|nr:glycosyltransferase family 1 protein [Thermoanaerobaculia bacterium]
MEARSLRADPERRDLLSRALRFGLRVGRRVVRLARPLARRLGAPFVPLRRRAIVVRQQLPAIAVISRTLTRALRRRIRRVVERASATRLRVGVDIRPFYEPLTGVGWYLHHLLSELARRDEIEILGFGEPFVTGDGPRLHVALPEGVSEESFDFRGIALSGGTVWLANRLHALLASIHGCDLFFGANYFLPRSMSAVARRRVVTIHDLTFRRFPSLLQEETLANLNREMTRELFRADGIICVSDATRRDVLRWFEVDPRRVVTVHSGLAELPEEGGDIPLQLPPAYLLFVSTIEPRKNLDVLLTAFEMLKDDGNYAGSLVIAGKIGWKSEATAARFRSSRWRDAIVHLDYVPYRWLARIYRQADLFVFPSHYEGFGFPLLEAMSCGTPAIAARTSSLPEIGGDAALYFDPDDAGGLAAAIRRVISDDALRQELRRRGFRQAASFQWSRAAEETLAVFRRASGGER